MKINIWTAVIVIIVGLYDLAYVYNRRQDLKKSQSKTLKRRRNGLLAFLVLGIIFFISGIIMLFLH